jgi:thioredoxin 1
MPGTIIHLTTRQELKDFTKKSNAFIIDFTATWCKPCQTIKPLINQAFEQMKHYFDMVIVDAEKGSDICSFMKVKGFPTLVSFVNKEIVESVMGGDIEEVKHFFRSSFERVDGF